jgi:ankyrin repeat protein
VLSSIASAINLSSFIDFDRVHISSSFYSIHIHDCRQQMTNELHRCAEFGDLQRLKQLVEGGATIEEVDEDGMTALLMASERGHYEIVVYLVEHNANVAHIDEVGTTALHWACMSGKLSSVKCLLEHGARVTERSEDGQTPLLYAALHGSLEVVQYLLSSEGGASISETDDDGNTALFLAASGCCPSVVQWPLEYGGAQITDTDDEETSVWSVNCWNSLPNLHKHAYMYTRNDDGEYAFIDGEYVPSKGIVPHVITMLFAMLRVMVLHGSPQTR